MENSRLGELAEKLEVYAVSPIIFKGEALTSESGLSYSLVDILVALSKKDDD